MRRNNAERCHISGDSFGRTHFRVVTKPGAREQQGQSGRLHRSSPQRRGAHAAASCVRGDAGPGLAPEPLTATVLGSVVPSRTPPPTPHPGRRGLACRVHARFHGRRRLGRGPFVEFLSPRQASVRGQGFLKHHRHVFAEKQGTGFSLSGNAELRFFALPHDILLPAWPQAVALTPVGFRRSFTHSQCLGHPPGSWAQGAGARGTLSPVGIRTA